MIAHWPLLPCSKTGYEAQASDERATYREVHIHQRREA